MISYVMDDGEERPITSAKQVSQQECGAGPLFCRRTIIRWSIAHQQSMLM